MAIERRDTFRVRPTSREPIRVEIVGSGMLEVGEVVDISEGGVGVHLDGITGEDFAGLELEFLIAFPGSHAIYVRGIVRTVRVESGCVLGVQFVNLPAKALDAIRGYVSGRGRRHSSNFRVGS